MNDKKDKKAKKKQRIRAKTFTFNKPAISAAVQEMKSCRKYPPPEAPYDDGISSVPGLDEIVKSESGFEFLSNMMRRTVR